MPHQRHRPLLEIIEKRLKLFPVVGILGARQTGKSTLLRELLAKRRAIKYVTLDREEIRVQAIQRPTLFLQGLESPKIATVCIDEVQKAPSLFDTIKAEVDEKKYPGRFALSGSVEFSKKTGVRESLTGRISLLRLFPLNVRETLNLNPCSPLLGLNQKDSPSSREKISEASLSQIKNWTKRGGMPGIFAVRESENRDALWDAWVETTCMRDLAQFKIPRFNPDLARRILTAIATCETPNILEVGRIVGKLPRQIQPYLEAFKALYIVYEIEPYVGSTGKSLYYLFDAGIAHFLNANEKRCLEIWFLNECFSQFSYAGTSKPDIFYYLSSKHSRMDFVVETKDSKYAVLIAQEEAPSEYFLRSAYAFKKKYEAIPVYVLAPCLHVQLIGDGVKLVPWSAVV